MDGKYAEVEKLDKIGHFYMHPLSNGAVHLFLSAVDAWEENSPRSISK